MTESPAEAIKALRDALEADLPASWHAPGMAELHDSEHRCIGVFCDTDPVPEEDRPVPDVNEGDRIAAYIAACHPERIRAMLDYVQGLEKHGPAMEYACTYEDGKRVPVMGTMLDVLDSYKEAAKVESQWGDEAREEVKALRKLVQGLEATISDAMYQSLRCPKDHDWRPVEMRAAQPRPECSEVAALRERVQGLGLSLHKALEVGSHLMNERDYFVARELADMALEDKA